MKPAGLVLDFDGTILDTEHSMYRSWADLWERHDQELELQVWQSQIGLEHQLDPLTELEARLGRSLAAADVSWRTERRNELLAREQLREGVSAWLATAAEFGLPVGVASSSPTAWVEGHLERLGLRRHFACLVCRDDGLPAKPDPACYRSVCERLGAEVAVSVAVEDSPPGVAAASAAGMYTIAVPHRLTVELDFTAADLVVESLGELSLADSLDRALHRSR